MVIVVFVVKVVFTVFVVLVDQVVSLDLYVWYHRKPGRKISFGTAFMNIRTNKKDLF